MEEEQIEEWYSREKEKITEEYRKTLVKADNRNIDKERAGFEAKLKKMIEKYNGMHKRKYDEDHLRKKMHQPIKHLKNFLDELSDMFNEKE